MKRMILAGIIATLSWDALACWPEPNLYIPHVKEGETLVEKKDILSDANVKKLKKSLWKCGLKDNTIKQINDVYYIEKYAEGHEECIAQVLTDILSPKVAEVPEIEYKSDFIINAP